MRGLAVGRCYVMALALSWVLLLGSLPAADAQVADLGCGGTDDLHALHSRVQQLYQAGKYAEAIPVAQCALALAKRLYDPDAPVVASRLNDLAMLYYAQGQYPQAAPLYKRALAIMKKARGSMDLAVAPILNNLGELYRVQGQYPQAEPLFKEARAIVEQAQAPMYPDVAAILNSLALLYHAQGQYTQAERLYKQVLAIVEQALGPLHPQVALTLNNLAKLYKDQGQYAQAESLNKQALAIRKQALGPLHPDVAVSLNNLAVLYKVQGQYAQAESLYKQALAIRKQALGPLHPDVAISLDNLAALYHARGQYAQAESLFKKARAIIEKALGPLHLEVATSFNNLAALYKDQGQYAQAKPLYRRALTLIKMALGADHPQVALGLSNVGDLYFRQRDWARAVYYWQQSSDLIIRRSRRGVQTVGSALTSRDKSEAEQWPFYFWSLVKASYRLVEADHAKASQTRARMFEVAQWAHNSEAAKALAQMATRHTKGNGVLAGLIRERQDLVREWQAKDNLMIAAVSQAFDKRNATAERELRDRLSAIDVRISDIDRTLAQEFPAYAALANSEPLSVADVRALLTKDEAVILFLDTPRSDPTPEETFIWIVTKTDDPKWFRIDWGTPSLQREVRALRCGLDEEEWSFPSDAKRCGDMLGLKELPDFSSKPLPFHLGKAHALYRALLGPVEDLIKGKRLFIVPSGPLTSLPFQVLVTKKPETALPTTFEGYRDVVWLGRTTALTVLPSVASLKALRVYATKGEQAVYDYIGYGNPVLKGEDRTCGRAQVSDKSPVVDAACPQQDSSTEHIDRAPIGGRGGRRSPSLDEVFSERVTSATVSEQVRALCPLPETAYEITCIAKHFQESARLIRLAADATKADIQALSAQGTLARYRIVHFATHGLLAGDVEAMTKRQGEPAIILTPPDKPQDANDDGLLRASEIAQLKLNADWVVLSACNTAAGDKPGAEALSGLARAFFYAQARALLVSHWPVYSDAAVRLTTRTFAELDRDRQLGRAEALQHAMIDLMDDPSEPKNAHPAVWAPFIVVGEGGR